jgi:hypothetical protein
MSDRQQDHIWEDEDSNDERPQPTLVADRMPDGMCAVLGGGPFHMAVPFRLVVDFVIETNTATEFTGRLDVTPHQHQLFITIVTNPEALNRMARLAAVSELEVHGDDFSRHEFEGPNAIDILDCVQPYLSVEEKKYWERLRDNSGESLGWAIMTVFSEFRATLKRIAVLEMAIGAEIPRRVASQALVAS